jgi:cell division septation protein DedD
MKPRARWLVFSLLPLVSCSLSQFGGKGEPKTKESKPEAVAYQEDFDPLTLNDDDIKITPPDRTGAGAAAQQRTVVVPKTEKSQSSGEMVQGFRIQLMATTSETQAREIKKNAMVKLQGKIYLVFEGAQYKIRMGDFLTRDDANGVLETVKAGGYPDAWIVRSMVVKAVGG